MNGSEQGVVGARPAAAEPSDPAAVGLLMKSAQHEFRLAVDAALAPLEISISQVRLLHTVDRHPGASSVRLAHLVFLTPQSLGQQLAQMQRRGYVERVPGRGRRLRHYLTDEGKRICDLALEKVREVDAEILSDLSEAELAQFEAMLRTVKRRAAQVRAEAKRDALLTYG